jgi:hypothetical protein
MRSEVHDERREGGGAAVFNTSKVRLEAAVEGVLADGTDRFQYLEGAATKGHSRSAAESVLSGAAARVVGLWSGLIIVTPRFRVNPGRVTR